MRGTVSFATAGPNTRTTQVFVNLRNNSTLDDQGFSPVGEIVEGLEVVDSITDQYGQEPNQSRIEGRGNEYLQKEFPELDYIVKASIHL